MTTRAKTQLTLPNGATVWLSACWVSGRGQTSPSPPPVDVAVAGGGVLPISA